jgi:FKBP-type peptidyl-prolyl cis-trans isomerase 2
MPEEQNQEKTKATKPATITKNDFIELEFTGRTGDQIFDTTNPKEAEKIGIQEPKDIKPLIISVGHEMMLKGLDEQLEGKELNKEYTIHIKPDKAFGPRNPQLIRTYGLANFTKNNINPYPGMSLQLDNQIAKILSVSGGRVTVDFNNPMAGKEVDYTYKINKLITDNKEKIEALQDFFFKQQFKFIIKNKKVIFNNSEIKPIMEMLQPKFKEMTGFDFQVEETKEKKEETKDSKEEDIKEKPNTKK